MARALVLLKDLRRAKTRLAPLLSAAERQSLARAMFEDVVRALRDSGEFATTVALVGCARGARIARQCGAEALADAALQGRDINERVARWVRACAADEELLLVHADLPLLSAAHVRDLRSGRRDEEVLIAADVAGAGTNAILTEPRLLADFAWGRDSARRHSDLCRDRRLRHRVVTVPGFSRDIDSPEHCRALFDAAATGPRSAAVIAEIARSGRGTDAHAHMAAAR